MVVSVLASCTAILVDTRLWKTKNLWKSFQNFRQSCVLLTDRNEIHQLQPLVWPSNPLYVMLSGCDWCISIRSVNNTQDWRKFWKSFHGCFVFQSPVSTKTVVRVWSQHRSEFLSSFPLLPLTREEKERAWKQGWPNLPDEKVSNEKTPSSTWVTKTNVLSSLINVLQD